jgi:hypothetical protein
MQLLLRQFGVKARFARKPAARKHAEVEAVRSQQEERRMSTGRHIVTLATLLAALACGTALAQERTVPTGTQGVQAFPAPPHGFDPLTASDRALDEYGFPPRPDSTEDPEQYQSWIDMVSPGIERILPRFGKPIAGNPRVRRAPTPVDPLENWSGYAFVNDGVESWGSQSFRKISANWTVPNVRAPQGTCKRSTPSSASDAAVWIGIDGYVGASTLIQAGTNSDAFCTDGKQTQQYFAWYEFLPNLQTPIENLEVEPGQHIAVTVWATSPTSGRVYLANKTTGKSFSLKLKANPGVALIGRTAEFIVERTETKTGVVSMLANFGQVVMTDASTSTGNQTFVPGKTIGNPLVVLDAIPMYLNNPNKFIAVPNLLGAGSFRVRYTGK